MVGLVENYLNRHHFIKKKIMSQEYARSVVCIVSWFFSKHRREGSKQTFCQQGHERSGLKLMKCLLWFRFSVFPFHDFATVSQDCTNLVITTLYLHWVSKTASYLTGITWKKEFIRIGMYINEGFSYHFKHITCTRFDRLNVSKISRRELFQPYPVTLERKGKESWWEAVVSSQNDVCPT